MNKNITLDFTSNKAMESVTANQELAIMPAELAKKLLKEYAKKLQRAYARDIINPLIEVLTAITHTDSSGAVTKSMEVCAEYIQERMLIDNCSKENWNVFAVSKEQEPLTQEKLHNMSEHEYEKQFKFEH